MVCGLVLMISMTLNLAYNKNKLYKILRLLVKRSGQFRFFRKGPGNSFSTTKIFLALHSINRPNFIVWLPLLLEILGNMYITMNCCPDYVLNFEISLIFLIKFFSYITGNLRQNFKYLEKGKDFMVKRKKHFLSFSKGVQMPKIVSLTSVFL